MKIRILYALVAVLAGVLLWQIFSTGRVYEILESNSMHQSVMIRPSDGPLVTVLAFVDYATAPTRDIDPIVMQAAQDAGNVRIIFHPAPQDSETMRKVARVAMAAANIKRDQPGGYAIVHDVMVRNTRPLTDTVIRDLAQRMGIDGEALLAESEAPHIYERMMVNIAAAQRLGVRGTPSYIFNRKGLYMPQGAFPTVDQFRTMIETERLK
jgi:protein-disulfide isomerase